MSSTFVDTNVILDILQNDKDWAEWSSARIVERASVGRLVVNAVVLAEVSNNFSTWEELNQFVRPADYEREDMPFEAAFVASIAHREYRKRGGTRLSTLPDFFVGAHAAVRGYTLLTRDARRYRTYFPKLKIVAP